MLQLVSRDPAVPFITATDSSRVTYAVYHPNPIKVELLSQ